MLCGQCQNLFSQHLQEDELDSHWGIRALGEQAKRGCHLCLLVWNGIRSRKHTFQELQRWIRDNPGKDTSTYVTVRHDEIYPALEFIFKVDDGDSDVEADPEAIEDGFEISMEAGLRGNNLSDEVVGLSATSTGSEETVNTIRTWIQTCQEQHSLCAKNLTAPKSLPTRLVEVKRNNNDLAVRLCLTSDLHHEIEYLTLSHCWGGLSFLKLVRDNLRDMMETISISTLPQTFQEAIELTHRLGFSYIWIDSLCIIQDSAADWTAEATRMADVYSNSRCNLAASASKNGSEGLFRTRNTSLACALHVETTWTGENLAQGWYTLVYADPYEVEILPEPLNRRAWVFQERVLARRTLHFGSHQVHWKCRENMASEAFPTTLPFSSLFASDDAWLTALFEDPRVDAKYAPGFVPKALTAAQWAPIDAMRRGRDRKELIEANLTELRDKLYQAWTELVEEYTECDLTFASDRPLAISGVACAMTHKLDKTDRYMAGMWESRLLGMLLFRRYKPAPRKPKPQRAPSWSWLARDGKVNFPNTLSERRKVRWQNYHLAEVVAIDLDQNPRDDRHSHFPNGTLWIKGLVIRVSVTRHPNKPSRRLLWWTSTAFQTHQETNTNLLLTKEGDQHAAVWFDYHKSSDLEPHANLHMLICIRQDHFQASVGDVTQIEDEMNTHEYNMNSDVNQTKGKLGDYGSDDDPNEIHGLVLEPTGQAKGQFRRRGVFYIRVKEYEEMLLRIASQRDQRSTHERELNNDSSHEEICDANKEYLEPEYEGLDADGQYIISII